MTWGSIDAILTATVISTVLRHATLTWPEWSLTTQQEAILTEADTSIFAHVEMAVDDIDGIEALRILFVGNGADVGRESLNLLPGLTLIGCAIGRFSAWGSDPCSTIC